MSSSSQYYNNRNTLELKVGKKATIQLQLHLRACDIQWFNDDSKEYIAEILSLVSSNVIPTLFEEKQEDETKADIGSTKSKVPTKNGKASSKSTNDNKRKASAKDTKAKTKKTKVSNKSSKKDDSKPTYLSTMKTKYLFGDNLQISYQVQSIQCYHRAILTFDSNLTEDENKKDITSKPTEKDLSTFQQLRPLPYKIVVWCYPFDQLNPKQPVMDITETDGFPRVEFLPLSSLFKEN